MGTNRHRFVRMLKSSSSMFSLNIFTMSYHIKNNNEQEIAQIIQIKITQKPRNIYTMGKLLEVSFFFKT